MNLLGRHLTGLATFSGRENRQPFWLWILIVYAIQMIVGIAVMIPMIFSTFDRMAPMMQGDPHRFDEHPELVMQIVMPIVGNMMVVGAIVSLIWVASIAAAVVRRLHDSDRTGWWAAPVLAMHIVMPLVYLNVMPRMLDIMTKVRPGATPIQMQAEMARTMQPFAWLSLLGMISFLLMIVLIVFLCLPGTQGTNRYGEDPLAFQ